MKSKMDDLPGGVEQSNGKIAWKGDIFDQVINKDERRGRVRGVGLGVCPTNLWGQSCANQSMNMLQNNEVSSELIHRLVENMKVMQEKHREDMQMMAGKARYGIEGGIR